LGRETDHAAPLLAELNDLRDIDDFRVRVRNFALREGRAIPQLLDAPRRAAEILLEEGELLALRLPERAKPLLQEAAKQFEKASDAFGQFRYAVSVAYLDHSQDRASTVDYFHRIAEAYDKCRAQMPDLPE